MASWGPLNSIVGLTLSNAKYLSFISKHIKGNVRKHGLCDYWNLPTQSVIQGDLTEKDMTPTLNPGKKRWLVVEAKPRPCAQRSNSRILFLTKTALEVLKTVLCFLKPYL